MQSFFTVRQWKWVKERYDEGYSMEALSDFLGINRRSIRAAFVRLGFFPEKKADLPPLAELREEFQALRTEDRASASPVECESAGEFKAVKWLAPKVGSAGRAERSPD